MNVQPIAAIDPDVLVVWPALSLASVHCEGCGESHGHAVVLAWLCFQVGLVFGGKHD